MQSPTQKNGKIMKFLKDYNALAQLDKDNLQIPSSHINKIYNNTKITINMDLVLRNLVTKNHPIARLANVPTFEETQAAINCMKKDKASGATLIAANAFKAMSHSAKKNFIKQY
jgi:hypothetical protein